MNELSVVAEYVAERGIAKPRRRLRYHVEYGLELVWRPADDVEHVARRRLVFQRLLNLAGPRLHLLEQTRILDCDHRLVGEGLDEFDLLVCKGQNHATAQEKTAESLIFAEERDGQGCTMTELLRDRPAQRELVACRG
jgi:hypothetical protein